MKGRLAERAAALADEVETLSRGQNSSRRKAGMDTLKIAKRLHALRSMTLAQQVEALGMTMQRWIPATLKDEKGRKRSITWASIICTAWERMRNYPELVKLVEEGTVSFFTMQGALRLSDLDGWQQRCTKASRRFIDKLPQEKEELAAELFVNKVKRACEMTWDELLELSRRASGRPENKKTFLGGWMLPSEVQDWKDIVAACEAITGEEVKATRFTQEMVVVLDALREIAKVGKREKVNEQEVEEQEHRDQVHDGDRDPEDGRGLAEEHGQEPAAP